jgi:DNA adenine methylase
MQYMGGKSRIAKQLAAEINKVRKPGQLVWDAFCGGLSMSVALSDKGPVLSSDANAALVNMHRAVQSGWDPPRAVSESEYEAAKHLPDTDPMKAFCAICCSFSGKWFGGYARSGERNYALNGHNALTKHRFNSDIRSVDFLTVNAAADPGILYLDPPYAGTTGYDGASAFDHTAFVHRVAEWSVNAHVFVSEYAFTLGECIWERPQTTTVARDKSKYSKATERLYYIGPTSWAEALRRAESE